MRLLFAFVFFMITWTVIGQDVPLLKFKENKKQWPAQVRYMADFYNGSVFLEDNAFVYRILNKKQLHAAIEKQNNKIADRSEISGHVYRTIFLNSLQPDISEENLQSEYYNYFLGNDPAHWSADVKAYTRVNYSELYKGIDMQIYSSGTHLKYDLIVKPGSDPGQIQIEIADAGKVTLVNNIIHITTNAGTITEQLPIVYQLKENKQNRVACEYKLKNNIISFSFPEGYDKTKTLIIDPIVVTATFTGSTSYCNGEASGYDENGNAYLAGSCASSAFPTTTGAFQTSLNGSLDITLHKFNTDGSALLFASYVGGSDEEKSFSVSVHKNEIILFGYSKSSDFPVSQNAFDISHNGGTDMIISKFDTTGQALSASTYIGGSGEDGEPGAWMYGLFRNFELVNDDAGNVYAVSTTTSTNFPVSNNAYSTTLRGAYDAVAFKLDASLQNMLWSTYFGGNVKDCANSLRLDGTGGIYCTGTTDSHDFPTTSGAASPNFLGGGLDCFVAHLNSDGSALISSSYIGTAGNDIGYLLALDVEQNVFIYSLYTSGSSTLFTPSPGAYNVTNGRNIIHKFTPDLSQILVKARFGTPIFVTGASFLAAASFDIDSCGNIYIAGDAGANFPTTPNAVKQTTNNFDLYFCVLKKDATALSYGSYYGGNASDWATWGICKISKTGILYYSFNGNNATPVTSNAYAQSNMPPDPGNTNFDHGFLKVDLQTFLTATSYSSELNNGCAPYSMTFTNQSATTDIEWNFGDGTAPVSQTNPVSHTYSNVGSYEMLLIATDNATCNNVDTLITKINVFAKPQDALMDSVDLCLNNEVELDAKNSGLSYLWSTGQTTQSISTSQPNRYHVTIYNPGCAIDDSAIVFISKANFPVALPNIITPNADNLNDKLDISDLSLTDFRLTIFDRWGREVYSSDNASEAWNGTTNGVVIDGTYFYTLSYKTDCLKETQNTKGFITVIK